MKLSLINNQNCFLSMLVLSLVFAAPLEGAERAHEHGVGSLSVAVEGHDVEIELVVPGADVVGFEHPPSSEREKQAVIAGADTLRDVKGIIVLSPDGKCRVEDVEISSGLLGDKKDNHSGGHKHEHEAKDKDDHKEVHSEFVAHYHFHCDNPKQLMGAKLGFFKVFPSAYELEAKWITPKGQGAAELTAKSSSLTF
ncbi:MAG: hypothetical protein CMF69_06030 [Magnetovibrio sp.]|nr:hypothetical protein [Magnetovibrio sp.]|tara:strand:- start:51 stop:638 length:588 start_codon:yes stop_codon:yes gene_type:complete